MVAYVVTALAVLLLTTACKPGGSQTQTATTNATTPGPTQKSDGFYAADPEYLQKNVDFFFQIYNDGFITKLADLPTSGEVEDLKKPYSGYWYPEKNGGTNIVISDGKSPLQKYDQAYNKSENKAAKWESDTHNSTLDWAGHCNGMSAAAERHPQQPTRNITKNGVVFTPLDIKALMAEIYMNADYEFLAGYRCESADGGGNPLDRTDKTKMNSCDDTNPGTFHTILANWVGRKGQTVIMDKKSDTEVWNFPYYKYEVIKLQKDITLDQARNYVTANAVSSGAYVFNPDAKSFAYVETHITYANALGAEALNERKAVVQTLAYVLEMNAAGEIIGGEWVGASQKTHPDFIWLALGPGVSDGSRGKGNPHLDSAEVLRLWAESAGLDPNKLPATISRPEFLASWGKFPNFEVKLDGSERGAVFTGKPLYLAVTRKEPLKDASLTLILNGTTLTTLPGAGLGLDPIKYEIKTGPGLNGLRLQWKKGDLVIDDRYVRFHVMR